MGLESTTRGVAAVALTDIPRVDPRITRVVPISTGFSDQERVYNGQIVGQNGENTCALVSLENAVIAAGGEVSDMLRGDLYAEAMIEDEKGEPMGLTFDVLQEIVDAYPELGIGLSGLEREEMLLPTNYQELSHPTYETAFVVRRNAEIIKNIIDSNDAIVTSIFEPGEAGYHAVAIVGYRIDSNGYMTLQYIDGEFEFVEMPLEFFSSRLVTNNDLKSKKHFGDVASVRVHINSSRVRYLHA